MLNPFITFRFQITSSFFFLLFSSSFILFLWGNNSFQLQGYREGRGPWKQYSQFIYNNQIVYYCQTMPQGFQSSICKNCPYAIDRYLKDYPSSGNHCMFNYCYSLLLLLIILLVSYPGGPFEHFMASYPYTRNIWYIYSSTNNNAINN